MGRLSCWIIVTGSESTAFRATDREELLPTLKQLQRTQPDAMLRWFARGRLWDSPEQASEALRKPAKGRGKSWRPGGNHVDPRERYTLTRDQKRARFKRRSRSEATINEGNRPISRSRPRKPRTQK